MSLGEARAAVPSSADIKSGDPKPVTYGVWVDPTKSIVELCKEAGLILRLNPYELGEWPSGPFNHDDRGKPKTNRDTTPYTVKVSDGSDTVGKTWEKAIKAASKDRKGSTLHEGIALVRDHPEILDNRRLVLPGTSYGTYDVVQIAKRKTKHGDVVEIRPIFVGDTNTDHVVKNGTPVTRLPFSALFVTREKPQPKAA